MDIICQIINVSRPLRTRMIVEYYAPTYTGNYLCPCGVFFTKNSLFTIFEKVRHPSVSFVTNAISV